MSGFVSTATIAARFGVSPQVVAMWASRYDDFPAGIKGPVTNSKLRRWDAVRAWGIATGRWDPINERPIRPRPGRHRRRSLVFHLCHFCRNRGVWRYPSGWRICSSCRPHAEQHRWDELARRWIRAYPDQWVSDIAAFIEGTLEGERPS